MNSGNSNEYNFNKSNRFQKFSKREEDKDRNDNYSPNITEDSSNSYWQRNKNNSRNEETSYNQMRDSSQSSLRNEEPNFNHRNQMRDNSQSSFRNEESNFNHRSQRRDEPRASYRNEEVNSDYKSQRREDFRASFRNEDTPLNHSIQRRDDSRASFRNEESSSNLRSQRRDDLRSNENDYRAYPRVYNSSGDNYNQTRYKNEDMRESRSNFNNYQSEPEERQSGLSKYIEYRPEDNKPKYKNPVESGQNCNSPRTTDNFIDSRSNRFVSENKPRYEAEDRRGNSTYEAKSSTYRSDSRDNQTYENKGSMFRSDDNIKSKYYNDRRASSNVDNFNEDRSRHNEYKGKSSRNNDYHSESLRAEESRTKYNSQSNGEYKFVYKNTPRTNAYSNDVGEKRVHSQERFSDQNIKKYRQNEDEGYESKINRQGDSRQEKTLEPTKGLAIFGLSPFTTEDDLKEVFDEAIPSIKNYSMKLVVDSKTGLCKGYCFVEFSCLDHSMTAKDKIDGEVVKGFALRPNYCIRNPKYN